MKKLCCLLLMIFAVVLPAAADSVWMPMDDYFMDTWKPESDNTCESLARQMFMASGKDGFVTAVRTPMDPAPLKTYPNGTEFLMNFMCGIGNERWGTVRAVRLPGETVFKEDYSGKSGYISQKELIRSFDADAFSEVFADEIRPYDRDDFNVCKPNPFVVWSYPNSGVQLEVITEGILQYYCHEFYPEYFPIHMDRIYTDPAGVRWVRVEAGRPLYRGWLNLDSPMEGAVIQSFE